jgi:hypothetical protein
VPSPKTAVTPPAAKPKFCTSKIREIVEVKVCGEKLRVRPYGGEYCPNRDNHLFPIPTGFCNSGWCEGTKGALGNGKFAPTCKSFINCPCDCHARLNRMFHMAGTERVLVDESSWHADNPFVLPTREIVVPTDPVADTDTESSTELESAPPVALPAGMQRIFLPTPSGRTGRGELESWVKEVTDAWVVDREGLCTPRHISQTIARVKGVKPPSVGAIDAVFNRWAEIGFAVIEKKPTRFGGYTEAGLRLGLEVMRAAAKRNK